MREVLEACPYGDNDVYLHTDPALMPVRRGTWASWNFIGTSSRSGADAAVCVSYWVNNLQVSLMTVPFHHTTHATHSGLTLRLA